MFIIVILTYSSSYIGHHMHCCISASLRRTRDYNINRLRADSSLHFIDIWAKPKAGLYCHLPWSKWLDAKCDFILATRCNTAPPIDVEWLMISWNLNYIWDHLFSICIIYIKIIMQIHNIGLHIPYQMHM